MVQVVADELVVVLQLELQKRRGVLWVGGAFKGRRMTYVLMTCTLVVWILTARVVMSCLMRTYILPLTMDFCVCKVSLMHTKQQTPTRLC